MRPIAFAALLLALACSSADAPELNPLERPPVDAARVGDAEDVVTWPYQKSVRADLDGDGDQETVILASDVTVQESTGRPIWEDGHRWAVLVEDDGEHTLLYGAFVPNGFVEAALGERESDGIAAVIVAERSPRHFRVYDIVYEAPGEARLRSAANYPLAQWWPDSATLR